MKPASVLACGHSERFSTTARPLHYDRQGRTVCLDCWTRLYTDDYKRVFIAILGKGSDQEVTVSTVWLGLDHQYGSGPPLIFETMVFAGGSMLERYCERYTTEEQAAEGHERVVTAVRDGSLDADLGWDR